jgi:hypothetical protein
MAAYSKFTVIGSKITVTQLNNPAPTTNGYLFLTHSTLADPLSGESNDPTAFESSFIVRKPLLLADTTGNQRNVRVGASVALKKFFKQKVLQEEDYTGGAASGPTKQAYWTIYYQTNAGSDPDSANFLVELEYIAVFRSPIQIGSS